MQNLNSYELKAPNTDHYAVKRTDGILILHRKPVCRRMNGAETIPWFAVRAMWADARKMGTKERSVLFCDCATIKISQLQKQLVSA